MLVAAYTSSFLLSGSNEAALLGLKTQACPFFPLRYQDLSVIKNVIVPTVVIGPPIVSFFLVVINALFLTIFCGWKGKNTDADEQEETPYRRAVRRQIELDDIVMEKLQPKWDREEAEEKEQKAQEALEKRKKRKERKERFNKGVPHDVKKKRKERKERANKGVPHDAHQEMDTNTSPAFQMAPRYVYPYLSLCPHKSTPRDLSRRQGSKPRRPTPITRDIHSTRLKTPNSYF